MIIHKTGDIFTTETGVIGHGVNCKGVMGSGIAVTVRKMFPDVYKAYREQCQSVPLDERLRGGDLFPCQSDGGTWILNIASQEEEGANADYGFLETAVERAFQWCVDNDVNAFSLPRIGSGVGNLDEVEVERILSILADKYPNVDLELWTYTK